MVVKVTVTSGLVYWSVILYPMRIDGLGRLDSTASMPLWWYLDPNYVVPK